jgi:uncharacterized protein YcfL
MKKILIICLLCLLCCGCSQSKYTLTTETKTSFFPYAQENIERVDFSVQFRKEW